MLTTNQIKVFCLGAYILFALTLGVILTVQQLAVASEGAAQATNSQVLAKDFKPAKQLSDQFITLAQRDQYE